MWHRLPVKDRMELMESYKRLGYDYNGMKDHFNQQFENGGKVELTSGGEKHLVYEKESPTGNGKGIEGHIMVNHPTKDKGKWDTIDLTDITNYKVKTVDQGVASVKKWHKENPEYRYGGIKRFDEGGDFNNYKQPGPLVEQSKDDNLGMTGLMKSKIAAEAHYGNPAALRMVSPNPNKYTWTGEEKDWEGNQASPAGYTGTHYMGSFGNQARPGLQEVNGKMQYFQNPPYNSKENFNFSRPEEAQYFAEHYKEVAPMMRNYEEHRYGGIQKFEPGGKYQPGGDKVTVSPYQDEGSKMTKQQWADYQNELAYKQSMAQAKQEQINDYVKKGHSLIVNNPVFKAAAYATPVGATVGAIEGAVNAVPDIYNFAKNPSLSGAGSIGMDALMMTPLAGEIKNAVNASKESGLLSNAYKVNPFAFKPNAESYYRVIGENGYKDAIENNIIRPKLGSTHAIEYPTFKKGVPLDNRYASSNVKGLIGDNSIMVESNGNKMVQNRWTASTPDKNVFIPRRTLTPNTEGVKFYKKDWWQGYKEVPKELLGSSNTAFYKNKTINPIYNTSSLPKELEPYLSKKIIPSSTEDKVYESFLSPEMQQKKAAQRIINYDKQGNIIKKKQGGLMQFGNGGTQLPTNGLNVHKGIPSEQNEDNSPLWWKGSRYPSRIQDETKRDEAIKNYYWNVRDEGASPDNALRTLKENNSSYGSDRFTGTRPDYFENYHGFDYNDINDNKIKQFELEYNKHQYGGIQKSKLNKRNK